MVRFVLKFTLAICGEWIMRDTSGYGSLVRDVMLSKDEINAIWTRIVVMEMNRSKQLERGRISWT